MEPPCQKTTPADLYAQLWEQSDRAPDLDAFLKQFGDLPSSDVATVLLVDQSFRWQRGCELSVEEYAPRWPQVVQDPELKLDLVYGELRSIIDRGETPDWAALGQRFPEFHRQLVRQAQCSGQPQPRQDSSGDTVRDTLASTVARSTTPHGAGVDPRAPLAFSDFQLQKQLGEGAMGTVHCAIQQSLGKRVALKILKPGSVPNDEAVDRFLREGRAVAMAPHPNIVDVHGVGRCPDGGYFLVMDLVEGTNLEQRLEQGPVSFEETVGITRQVAQAIAHANEQGVIHRDIKPSNVLIDKDGKTLVTDFGLAKLAQLQAREISTAGEIIGTPGFMAPEQADSVRWGEVGPATDVYGLGALFYALLTGRPPASGKTLTEVLAQVVSPSPVTSPRTVRSDIPAALETICMKCLAKGPADRYHGAREVSEALGEVQQSLTSTVAATDDRDTVGSAGKTWWNRVFVPGTVLLAAILLAVWFFGPRSKRTVDPRTVEVTWAIDVYPGGQPENCLRLTETPAAVASGDKLQLHFNFTDSVYAYVLWIDSEGDVKRLYPDPLGSNDARALRSVQSLSIPPQDGDVLPVTGKPGTEVCVLVLRTAPLADDVDLANALRPPSRFPPLDENTILKEGVVLTSGSRRPPLDAVASADPFPPPAAWLEGERPRGVGRAEPLNAPAALEYFRLWHQHLSPEIGEVRYLAIPHAPVTKL